MNSVKHDGSSVAHGEACLDLPDLRRLNYFFGQMLTAQDFQTEQSFFREKLKLHNRCLHGYGVVCGLMVAPVPIARQCDAKQEAEEKRIWDELQALEAQRIAILAGAAAEAAAAGAPAAVDITSTTTAEVDAKIETLRRELGDCYRSHCKDEPRTCVRVECGLALDCHGNELIVRSALHIDLLQWLSPGDYQRVKQGARELYVSICHCEQPVDPVRPVSTGSCGAMPECTYGKWQDGVRVLVTVDRPAVDERCGTCCEPCTEGCLLLARIDCFFPGHELHHDHIHNHVRRPISLYPPTTIIGVSWQHGHHYTEHQTKELMGTHDRGQSRGKGLEILFSKPVLASTIRPGVLDTWVIEGGRGRSGNIYNKSGEFVDKPKEGWVDRIFYRDTSDEALEPGDRVLVILRTDFILDKCCRPVDGENTGGRVPLLKEYAEKFGLHPTQFHEHCQIPPRGYGPWTSGNGNPGGTFESWFFVREEEREPRK